MRLIDATHQKRMEQIDTTNEYAQQLEALEKKVSDRSLSRASKIDQERARLKELAAKKEDEIQKAKIAAENAREEERNKAMKQRDDDRGAAEHAFNEKRIANEKAYQAVQLQFRKDEYAQNQIMAQAQSKIARAEAIAEARKEKRGDVRIVRELEINRLYDEIDAQLAQPAPFNKGGFVGGMGDRDSVNALLTPGEFVMPKTASQQYAGILESMRAGTLTNNIGGTTINIGTLTTQAKDGKQLINEILRYSKNLGSIPFAR